MPSRTQADAAHGSEPGAVLRMEEILAGDLAYQRERLAQEEAKDPDSRRAQEVRVRLARVERTYAETHRHADQLRASGHTLPPRCAVDAPLTLRGRTWALFALVFSISSW